MTTLADLAHQRLFCAWQGEPAEGGKVRKVPYGAYGNTAKSNTPRTFLPLIDAQTVYANLPKPCGVGGVGIFLGHPIDGAEGPHLVGFDFDSCFGADGMPLAWALDGLAALNSYTEMSPSRTGIKVFALMRPADAGRIHAAFGIRRGSFGRKFSVRTGTEHPPGVEAYLGVRFFALTGEQIDAYGSELSPFTAEHAQAMIERCVTPLLGSAPDAQVDLVPLPGGRDSGPLTVDNARLQFLLDSRPDFKRLWVGDPTDLSDDKSRSAFAMHIARHLRCAQGFTPDEIRALLSECPATAEWMVEKGEALGGREFQRTFEHAGPGVFETLGPLPLVPGLSSTDTPIGTKPRKKTPGDAQAALAASLKPQASRPDPSTAAPPAAPTASTDGRPVIALRVPLIDVVAEAEQAIIASGQPVFRHGIYIVRPYMLAYKAIGGRDTISVAFKEFDVQDALRTMSRAAHFARWNEKREEWVRCNPTKEIAEMWLSARGEWRMPAVNSIITVPTLRPDGSLLCEAGYDPATGLYLMPDPSVRLPDGWDQQIPTKADAEAALALLQSLVVETPFVSDIDRSVAISGMLTPVLRGLLTARPMHAMTAPEAGSGKSLLIDICTTIVLGRPAPAMAIGKTEEETEKRLGALLLAGVPVAVLDNVNGKLEGDVICQICDRPEVNVRILGVSKKVDIENGMCMFANGNNLTVVGDLVRRTITCHLDAQMENPESKVYHGDPIADIIKDRGRYIAAALTVVRAHALAGYPGAADVSPLASFIDWNYNIRGTLRWLGCADPLASQEQARRADPARTDLRTILRAWKMKYGTGNAGIRSLRDALEGFMGLSSGPADSPGLALGRIGADPHGAESLDMAEVREALLRVCGIRGVVDTVRFSGWMRRNEGRIMAGLKITRSESVGYTEVRGWTVEVNAPHLTVVALDGNAD